MRPPPESPRRRRLAAALLLAAGVAAQAAPARGEAEEPGPLAAFVSLEGEIDGLTERSMEARVAKALALRPRFLVVTLDTPGGEVQASRNIAWNLANLEGVTTVAWVRGWALSGGTLVAFGCQQIAMRPGGRLGDVMPIVVDAMGVLPPQVAEKMVAPVRADLVALAERAGYPADVAAAMVDPTVELHRLEVRDEATGLARPEWVTAEALERMPWARRERISKDEVVCAPGKLFVVGAEEAVDMGLTRIVADDERALLDALAHEFSTPPVRAARFDASWWEGVVRWVTWAPLKTLLFVIGVIAVAIAFGSPGLGAPEAVAAVCLGAVFFGSYLLGLADWVEVCMLVLGLALLAVEVFVTPGFGVLGVSGIALVFGALLLSSQRFVVPETPFEWDALQRNVAYTAGGGVATLAGLALLVRLAPRLGPLRGLVLAGPPAAAGPGATGPAATGEGAAPVAGPPVGATGEAATDLRPAGKVLLAGEPLDAIAEEGWVEAGTTVVVVGRSGAALVVAARREAMAPPGAGEVTS